MEQRRRLLFHAFAILTVAFALGLVAGPLGMKHHPHARLWMSAHVTGLLIGILMIGLGLARPHLQLGPRAGKIFFWSAVAGNWLGLGVLGIFASVIGAGTAIANPQLPAATGWHAAVIAAALAVVTVTTFATCFAALWGLRAGGRASSDA